MLQFSYQKRVLDFNFPAKTSRGSITTKNCFLISVFDTDEPNIVGWGECNTLKGLSIDYFEDYEERLKLVLDKINKLPLSFATLSDFLDKEVYPSIFFALETALLDLSNGGKKKIYTNSFYKGTPIPINGLVWMGDKAFMKQQIDEKLAKGFDCIKVKVGALNFEDELQLLKYIRSEYSPEEITLRVDANGAFAVGEAMEKLKRLSAYSLHSIEQPIWAGQWDEMAELCSTTPIPIALDEELIGIKTAHQQKLLETINPQYIILKPALVGGLEASKTWIALAEKQHIPWWMTSALESNIGLNAIAQFTANYVIDKPHGLGTGQLYHNNYASPLTVSSGTLFYDKEKKWEV
ncbi:o-succinylbenzoate synthase [Flammeovirga kamogawensis]|uniref:O-succinylbenzoate synthase n=1 Tax=Flammeovirga kamogawensis TaxID=373891 RepID=A0ABX8GXX7_9BACT|nr:o-succinylbenzoate synthase [Flammeovirga kamogawensis]MBB6460697.1 o-succinylbenzoate synthase [Flammeovirga kamogawensis]QWG08052.1 o-succinylbenzoate synthase [Flammeovirga kamogawensis]TRX70186.1 o-succinylbenzoate synthase [Flammeovirga kamogawensis]